MNYNVPNTIGWTEHDKLERFTNFFKIWSFKEDKPYERGNGYEEYNDYKLDYDVNGIFKAI